MTGLSPEARKLVVDGRDEQGLGTEWRDDVGDVLMARLGLPPITPPAPAPVPTTAKPFGAALAKLLVPAAKLAAVIAVVGGVGFGVHLVTRRPAAPAPVRRHTSHASPAATPNELAPAASEPPLPTSEHAEPVTPRAPAPAAAPPTHRGARAPVHEHAAPPTTQTVTPAPITGSLDEELALVRDAETALRSHAPARAIALLDQYGRVFVNGQFRQEALATRVRALCELGRVDEARTIARPLLAGHSVYAERVRASCAGISSGGSP